MSHLVIAAILGTLAGMIGRWFTLKIDYRQYPSYPQGLTIHMALAMIAAFLGAAVVPALLSKDFAAASLLALAATQFREIRNVERETLLNLESEELVPRGMAYIEGIARVFEARNYLTMITGTVSSVAAVIVYGLTESFIGMVLSSAAFGLMTWIWVKRGGFGPHVGDLVDLQIVPIEFDGPLLKVANIGLMNIAIEEDRERYLRDGLGVLMIPKNPDAKATMASLGQRQAIVHDAATLVGVVKETDQPQLAPLARRNGRTGEIALAIVPAEKNPDALLEAVRRVPVLEASVRRPTSSVAGQMID